MSYVAIPPGYYFQQQPGTPFQEGAPGWEQAPVPGWGDNPNGAWPKYQAANGLGAGAAPAPAVPRFSYVGRVPQQNYIRTSIAPWGSFPRGYAYDFPKESNCPTCIGWPSPQSIGNVIEASRAFDRGNIAGAMRAVQGLGCGPCEVSSGAGCQTCPDGSDLPECAGCVDGQAPAAEKSLLDHPLAGPVAVAVASTLAIGLVTYFAKRAKVPVG